MLINGTIRTNKTEYIKKRYVDLVNSGVSVESILVLCLNSYKKQQFLDYIQENVIVPVCGKYNVQTFYGLCYNSIIDNWPVVEESIKLGKSTIFPNLCGLELSRLFLSDSISEENFKDYFSKTNLIHQMFKRMQLTVLNGLTDLQVSRKSEILKETFYNDATDVYNKFRLQTLKYRSFDYLRQVAILPYIMKNTKYFSNIEYLFVDDADEMTYSEFSFVKAIQKILKEWIIAYDKDGASRCGYLSAYRTSVFEFEKIFNEKSEELICEDVSQKSADAIYKAILENKKIELSNFKINSTVQRLEMLDNAFEKIKNLLSKKVKPSDILLVTPVIDDMLTTSFNRFFGVSQKLQALSGSEKPKDCSLLRNIFTVLKLVHKDWNLEIETQDLRVLFFDCLNIPLKYSQRVVKAFEDEKELVPYTFEKDEFQKNYDAFVNFLIEIKERSSSFSSEIIEIFKYMTSKGIEKDDLQKFNFFLKEIRSFENAFGKLTNAQKKKILVQFVNGIISENPSVSTDIDSKALVVATPQKVIDFELKRKYHIWLDVSSELWTMRDIGVLYNAWVFNADWENREFTFEDNARLSNEKNARVLRKLMMCCDEKVYAYYSQYDSAGYENIGKMQTFFDVNNKLTKPEKTFKITPREDQKKVVEYNGGKAGVNAVPGAGKTTILIALLIKLLEQGVKPNNIFVLTYMESAANNIKEKIKSALPELNELPNISTIHGLSYRIIRENNHYTKLNLPDNVEVADDNRRQKILQDCIALLKLKHEDFADYQSGISAVKLSSNGIKPLRLLNDKMQFAELFDLYEKKLHKSNCIDYDDMLRYAVKLVEENSEIRDYYTNECHFVIEDEAQDSSELQQKLLFMLSAKHGNLLRIGDINQAITSSFTDSDSKGFKKYFEQNEQMVMKTSQRSAVQIQDLANSLIDFSKKKPFLKDSFFDSKLSPIEKNPKTDKMPVFKVLDSVIEEKHYVLNKIREIIKIRDNLSIGILLRNNYQVADWANFLSENGLSVTLKSDILEQKTVYRFIISYFKYLQAPFAKNSIINLMKIFNDCGLIKFSKEDFDFVKNLKEPFISHEYQNMSESLIHLWWDLQFGDELSYIPLDEAVVRIGLRYFSTPNEKSNVYLLATIIKNLSMTYSLQNTVIDKLIQIAKKPIGSSFKYFDEENETNFSVNLLTMHKSKGDEFDIVFIPEMSEENYQLDVDKIKNKSSFAEKVKSLRIGYKAKSDLEIKKEIAEETMRLIYVGITRAKEEVYISCSTKNKFAKTQTISPIFQLDKGGKQ